MEAALFTSETQRCNTVPIEKGTETEDYLTEIPPKLGCNTVPIEKGTETPTR